MDKIILLENLLLIEEQIHDRICNAIKTSGLSLTAIAEKVGISVATISYYKNKKKLPALPTFAILCKVLEVSPNEILE